MRNLVLIDGVFVRGEHAVTARVSLPVDGAEARRALTGMTPGAIERMIEKACGWPEGAAAFLSQADRRLLTRELRRQAADAV